MKRLCACLSVLLLFTALFCALPAFAATEIKIEAEQPDEWGGWAGVRDLAGTSGGKVLTGLNYDAHHVNQVAFRGWISQLEQGDYTLTIAYMTGDPNMKTIVCVNDEEIALDMPITRTTPGDWVQWEGGTISTTITLIGSGMDEILLYDGAEPGGVWIDYIELKKVGGGTTEPPVTQPETPTQPTENDPADTTIPSNLPETTTTQATSTAATKAAGSAVSTAAPSSPADSEGSGSALPFIIGGIVVVVLAGGGAALYFLKFRKKPGA